MFGWMNQNLAAIYSALAVGIGLVIYFGFKFQINLGWLNFVYEFPYVGKLARLAGDSTRFQSDQSWTISERTLSQDYAQFVHSLTVGEFEKRIAYLKKAGDKGRKPAPVWIWVLLVVLVIAEGLGFSYLLGTWMAMEGSENTRKVLMWAIVLVLCFILMWITHAAGHQLYRTNLVRRCVKEYKDAGSPDDLITQEIALNDDQSIDDGVPPYKQCVNRVGRTGSYTMVYLAAVVIVLIAALSTVMRVQHLDNQLTQDTAGLSAASPAASGNPFDTGDGLPPDVTKPQESADSKAEDELKGGTEVEGMAAFLMLAFIFVITQVVGISAGFQFGFAGSESKDAYKEIHGFSTYHGFRMFYEPIIQLAQAKLQSLQQKMQASGSNQHIKLTRTFDDYLNEQIQKISANTQRVVRSEAEPVKSTQQVPASQLDTVAIQVESIVSTFASLSDNKDAKRKILEGLAPELQDKVLKILGDKKALANEAQREDEERARRKAQMDDVL